MSFSGFTFDRTTGPRAYRIVVISKVHLDAINGAHLAVNGRETSLVSGALSAIWGARHAISSVFHPSAHVTACPLVTGCCLWVGAVHTLAQLSNSRRHAYSLEFSCTTAGIFHPGAFPVCSSHTKPGGIMRFQTAAAGLALSAAAGSVSGFVSPPQTASFLRHGASPARLSPSLAAPDRTPTARAATSMSLKPPRKQRLLPPWARPAAAARGLGRGFSLLRGAAAERDDDEEMYEYEDGDGDEYSDGEEELDRCKFTPPPSPFRGLQLGV